MTRPDWLLDEEAAAGAEHLAPAYVREYDRKAGFDPAEDLERLGSRGLGRGSIVIDLGCGTGEFALAAAALGATATSPTSGRPSPSRGWPPCSRLAGAFCSAT